MYRVFTRLCTVCLHVYVPCIYSLCTVYLHVYVPCIYTFMYRVFTVYVPCVYTFMYRVFTVNVPCIYSLCTVYLHACQVRLTYRRRLGSLLLCLCDVFRVLINSLVCCYFTKICSESASSPRFPCYVLAGEGKHGAQCSGPSPAILPLLLARVSLAEPARVLGSSDPRVLGISDPRVLGISDRRVLGSSNPLLQQGHGGAWVSSWTRWYFWVSSWTCWCLG